MQYYWEIYYTTCGFCVHGMNRRFEYNIYSYNLNRFCVSSDTHLMMAQWWSAVYSAKYLLLWVDSTFPHRLVEWIKMNTKHRRRCAAILCVWQSAAADGVWWQGKRWTMAHSRMRVDRVANNDNQNAIGDLCLVLVLRARPQNSASAVFGNQQVIAHCSLTTYHTLTARYICL